MIDLARTHLITRYLQLVETATTPDPAAVARYRQGLELLTREEEQIEHTIAALAARLDALGGPVTDEERNRLSALKTATLTQLENWQRRRTLNKAIHNLQRRHEAATVHQAHETAEWIRRKINKKRRQFIRLGGLAPHHERKLLEQNLRDIEARIEALKPREAVQEQIRQATNRPVRRVL